MRKQLGIFLSLLAMVLVAAAETQSTGTATNRATVQRVDVVRGGDALTVEITARGTVTPKLSALDAPARVVLDLPNTVLATTQSRIPVASGEVKGIRMGTDGSNPPTSRIVIDLTRACRYELVPGSNGKIVLKLHISGNDVSATAKPVVPMVPAAVPSPIAATAAVNKPSASVAATSTPASAETKPAPSVAANNFVFVEPSYKPKDASAPETHPVPAMEPSARAIAAATKFAEKPDANLLPTPSASMQSQAAAAAPQPAVNMAAEQKKQLAQQSAATGPKYTGEPISVNLKDVDLKDFFRLVHEISGLNVVLDPSVKGSLTIVLDDVPWDQALDIVLKNNELARQLDGNVLRIATLETLRKEAESRRAQQEAEALAIEKVTVTRFLSYAHSKDVEATVKKFLTQRGDVMSDDRTNAIIINDIPNVIPQIDRLLTQLDRKTQEVEIEARVVAATRSFARDIGTSLGFGIGFGHNAIGGAPAVGTSPTSFGGLTPTFITTGSGSSSSTSGVQIPMFSNLLPASPTSGIQFVNATSNFAIDAILSAAESRGLLKILSRPRVVTQNNVQAIVKQGIRVPIVTQAQLGGPPTVTYIDAFLRLTVTPQITSEGTIFLNVDVENTTPDFSRQVQGNPTLITQQATTQVLVTDGGTVVIGGVIQTNNSVNVFQIPLLGNIPYLGNLFKHKQIQTSNQELIFFITPRIIQT